MSPYVIAGTIVLGVTVGVALAVWLFLKGAEDAIRRALW